MPPLLELHLQLPCSQAQILEIPSIPVKLLFKASHETMVYGILKDIYEISNLNPLLPAVKPGIQVKLFTICEFALP
jgi:hypothetical protein